MIKLIKNKKTNKYRLVNTEKIINDEKNNKIFIDANIRFSYTYDINNIGKYNDEKEMVNLLMDNDKCYIPKIDIEITEAMFYFIKDELYKIINNYGNIIDYEIIYKDEENNMKDNVLEVEFERVFDLWAMKIVYQNFNVLKRGLFIDSNIKISSNYNIEYDRINNWLYVLGKNDSNDDNIIIVTDEEKEIIEDKIKKINEKYGVEKRWRAEKEGKYYFISGSSFYIEDDYDVRDNIDNNRYEIGNYFETEEKAKEKAREIHRILLK